MGNHAFLGAMLVFREGTSFGKLRFSHGKCLAFRHVSLNNMFFLNIFFWKSKTNLRKQNALRGKPTTLIGSPKKTLKSKFSAQKNQEDKGASYRSIVVYNQSVAGFPIINHGH